MCPVWLLERDNSRQFWSSFPFSSPQFEQLHVLSNSLSPAQMQIHFCHYSHFQTLLSAHEIPLEKGHQKPNQHSELLSQLPKLREITGGTTEIYFRTGKRNKPLIPDYTTPSANPTPAGICSAGPKLPHPFLQLCHVPSGTSSHRIYPPTSSQPVQRDTRPFLSDVVPTVKPKLIPALTIFILLSNMP